MNFDLIRQQNQVHDRFHLRYLLATEVQFYHIDLSCQICYPPHPTDLYFDNFWNWYSTIHPAVTYSNLTQNYINNLSQQGLTQQQIDQLLLNIIISIRYHINPGPIQNLIRELANAVLQTNIFRNDPLEILYQASEYTGST